MSKMQTAGWADGFAQPVPTTRSGNQVSAEVVRQLAAWAGALVGAALYVTLTPPLVVVSVMVFIHALGAMLGVGG